jgi:hypothetical protein
MSAVHLRAGFPTGYEGTPRVGNGVMYVSTAYPNHVFAFGSGNRAGFPGKAGRNAIPRPVRSRAARPSRAGLLAGDRKRVLHTFGRATVLAPKVVNERVDALPKKGTKLPSTLRPAASVLCFDRGVFIAEQSREGCDMIRP